MCRFLYVLWEFQSKRARFASPGSLRSLCVRTAPVRVLNVQCTLLEGGDILLDFATGDAIQSAMQASKPGLGARFAYLFACIAEWIASPVAKVNVSYSYRMELSGLTLEI